MSRSIADVSRDSFNVRNRYVAPLFLQGRPLVDSDLNESFLNLTFFSRTIAGVLGEGGTPGGDDWKILESSTNTTNNFTIEGGSGGLATAKTVFASGFYAMLLGDVEYVSNSKEIHARSNEVTSTTLTDSSANWEPDELVGRDLVPNIENGTTFTIVSNSKNKIEVSSGDMTTVAESGDRYRVNLSTPSGSGTRTDIVYLDVYVAEVDSSDEEGLLTSVAGTVFESARRLQIQQVVKVREDIGTGVGQFPDPIDPESSGATIRIIFDELGQRHGLIKLATLSRPSTQGDIAPSVGGNATAIADAVPRTFGRFAIEELKDFASTSGLGQNVKNALINPTSGLRYSQPAQGNPYATLNGDLSKLIDQSNDISVPSVDTIALEVRTSGTPTDSAEVVAVRIENQRLGAGLSIVSSTSGKSSIVVQQDTANPGIKITNNSTDFGLHSDVPTGKDGQCLKISSLATTPGRHLFVIDDDTDSTTGVGCHSVQIMKTGQDNDTKGNILDLAYDGTPDVDQVCLNITSGPAIGLSISRTQGTEQAVVISDTFVASTLSVPTILITKAGGTAGDVLEIDDSGDNGASIKLSVSGGSSSATRNGLRMERASGFGYDVYLEKAAGGAPTGLDATDSLLYLDPNDWEVPHMVLDPLDTITSSPNTAGIPGRKGALVVVNSGTGSQAELWFYDGTTWVLVA